MVDGVTRNVAEHIGETQQSEEQSATFIKCLSFHTIIVRKKLHVDRYERTTPRPREFGNTTQTRLRTHEISLVTQHKLASELTK